jgi:hypothetical protein
MLLLLSTIATRCDFSALIVNRKMTTLVGAERESLVGAERVPRLLGDYRCRQRQTVRNTRAPHPACSEKVGQNVPVVR